MIEKVKTDWVGLIALLLIVIGGGLVCYYYLVNEVNSCTANPVQYSINSFLDGEELNYSYAEIRVYEGEYNFIPLKIFKFYKK